MNIELSEQLYEKMCAEQDAFHDWLLQQPSEDIIEHAYEYSSCDDIVEVIKSTDLSFAQAQALLASQNPLYDIFEEFLERDTDFGELIRTCCTYCADKAIERVSTQPVYLQIAAYAREHDELEQYNTSHKLNEACASAIDDAIAAVYQDNRLKDVREASNAIIKTFGFDRTMFVLANTIRIKNYDGRISAENKAWAQTIPVCEDQRNIIVDRCNPGLLDLFTNQVRKDFAAEQSRSQQKTSVREKLHGTPARAAERSASAKKDRDAR